MDAVDFYFDFLSPYSYLAHSQLDSLRVPLRYVPTDVIQLMKLVNNTPTTILCAAKRAYAGKDLARWADRYGIPLIMPDMTRLDDGLLLCIETAANRKELEKPVVAAIFGGVWAGLGDASPGGVERLLAANDLPGEELLRLAGAADTAEALSEAVAQAARLGVFGAPTFRIGEELFFGNDRLDYVREHLSALSVSA